jgi:thymidylate synthase (FAD)
MGKVIIQERTVKDPITLIGEEAGICYGTNTSDKDRNYQRGLDCLKANHGRTLEFPDIYLILDGYSAKVIREWYTHLGGMPTRLQASTRYIKYQNGFDYVVPHTIEDNDEAKRIYMLAMGNILQSMRELEALEIPREDSSMLLPLGMETKVVCKHNLRNLIDMSHQRECKRAYWEYRELFNDIKEALSNYSPEWKYIVDNYFKPKCAVLGHCPETYPCNKTATDNSKKKKNN